MEAPAPYPTARACLGLAAPFRRTSCGLPDHSGVHRSGPVRDRMARTARQ
jgi:hypothetical protein